MKKDIKLTFFAKKWRTIYWFCTRKKIYNSFKKMKITKKFLKKCFQLICADKLLKTECRNFFKINESWELLILGEFKFPKFALHNVIINKIQTTKNLENSSHSFGDKYLTKHLVNFCKTGLNPRELELLA